MPKLLGVVDTLETVPEAYKAAYEQKDGKFFLKEIEFEDAAPLKEKLARKESAINEANGKLSRYSKFKEFDEAGLETLLELWELKKAGKPLTVNEKAELERLHQKALEKLKGELETERKGRATDQQSLKHYKLTVPLKDIALKAGVVPEDVSLALLETQGRFRLDENDKIVVLDADGDISDVTPQKFFETLYKEQRPKFYAASGSGGSGAQNGTKGSGNGKTMNRQAFEALSQAERMKISKEGVELVD